MESLVILLFGLIHPSILLFLLVRTCISSTTWDLDNTFCKRTSFLPFQRGNLKKSTQYQKFYLLGTRGVFFPLVYLYISWPFVVCTNWEYITICWMPPRTPLSSKQLTFLAFCRRSGLWNSFWYYPVRFHHIYLNGNLKDQ
jgi:hypothetical protein